MRIRSKRPLSPDQPLRLADHPRPVTRRQLIQQGFIGGGATLIGTSLFGLFADPKAARAAL